MARISRYRTYRTDGHLKSHCASAFVRTPSALFALEGACILVAILVYFLKALQLDLQFSIIIFSKTYCAVG